MAVTDDADARRSHAAACRCTACRRTRGSATRAGAAGTTEILAPGLQVQPHRHRRRDRHPPACPSRDDAEASARRSLERFAEAFARCRRARAAVPCRKTGSTPGTSSRSGCGSIAFPSAATPFIDELRERGVACSVHWRPLHLHPYYTETFGWRPEDLPTATAVWERLDQPPDLPGHARRGDRGRRRERPRRLQGQPEEPVDSRPRLGAGLPRPVEAALALGGLVAAAPVIGLCALAVLVSSGSPAFFRQTRVGRGGRPFRLVKLRIDAPDRSRAGRHCSGR